MKKCQKQSRRGLREDRWKASVQGGGKTTVLHEGPANYTSEFRQKWTGHKPLDEVKVDFWRTILRFLTRWIALTTRLQDAYICATRHETSWWTTFLSWSSLVLYMGSILQRVESNWCFESNRRSQEVDRFGSHLLWSRRGGDGLLRRKNDWSKQMSTLVWSSMVCAVPESWSLCQRRPNRISWGLYTNGVWLWKRFTGEWRDLERCMGDHWKDGVNTWRKGDISGALIGMPHLQLFL